ncbi:MAG: hypothetical protein Q8M15_03950 [Bacteroidota bacterium]|nr:hypothetical protein [Bacteroidota bacterium]
MQNEQKNTWNIISHFLHKHNELALSGVGIFSCEQSYIIVDPLAKIISPAAKKIHFLPHSDSCTKEFLLFFKEISGESESLIVDKLLQLAKDFNTELLANGKLNIEGFGIFHLGSDQQISFKQQEGDHFNADSFGLVKIHFAANLSKIKRIVVEKPILETQEDRDLTQMRESALRELKVLLDQAKISENAKPAKTSKIFPVVATVLTLILLVNLGLFLFKSPVSPLAEQVSKMDMLGKSGEILDSQTSTATVSAAKPIKVEPIITEPVLVENFDSLNVHIASNLRKGEYNFDSTLYVEPIDLSLPPTPVFTEPVKEESVSSDAKINIAETVNTPIEIAAPNSESTIEKGYYLIGGAFKGIKSAQKLQLELIELGHKDAQIIKPAKNKNYLVAYQRFENLPEAKMMKVKTQEEENWDVWIYTAP